MKKVLLPLLLSLLPLYAWGVYAPVPPRNLGTNFTVDLSVGGHYDSNILGLPDNEIDSTVFTLGSEFRYRANPTPQSVVFGSYSLDAFFYSDRPSDDTLFNHEVSGRYSHQFSPALAMDISDTFSLIEDPESFLNGLLQTNQSFNQNIFNFRIRGDVNQSITFGFKARHTNYSYDDGFIATTLNRGDLLVGAEGGWRFSPDASAVGEIRFQDVGYDTAGAIKDSDSIFFLAGVDYQPSPTCRAERARGVGRS